MLDERGAGQDEQTSRYASPAQTRRRAVRPAHVTWPLWGLLALFLCGFGPPTLLDRDIAPQHRFSVGQLRQIQRSRMPPSGSSALAVLVYDLDSGRVLMTEAADLPMSPASLAKLMTALLVLEQNRLTEQVTIQSEDLVGGATMGLTAGEVLTVEELLWGLLVPSGNDAAMALARHHAGQAQAFVLGMNLHAKELGLPRTQFVNPTGFDAGGQVSSARDLLTIVRHLWEYPLFRQIVGTASITVAGHALRTTNRLLGSYPGANGVKTGTTLRSGESLIAGVEQDGHQLFAIVLGSEDRYLDMQAALAAVLERYDRVPLRLPERPTVLDRVYDPAGKRWFLRAEGYVGAAAHLAPPVDVLLAEWERQDLRVFRRVHPPPLDIWSDGMQVGVLEWRLGDTVIATQRLVVR